MDVKFVKGGALFMMPPDSEVRLGKFSDVITDPPILKDVAV